MFRINVHHHIHFVDPDVPTGLGQRILSAVAGLKELIVMNDAQVRERLADISQQTSKVFTEVSTALAGLTATVQELQAALEAAGNASPEVVALLEELETKVGAIDNLIPDSPEPEPRG